MYAVHNCICMQLWLRKNPKTHNHYLKSGKAVAPLPVLLNRRRSRSTTATSPSWNQHGRADLQTRKKLFSPIHAIPMASQYFPLKDEGEKVYVKAKECNQQLSPEDFAIVLAKHFTSFYNQVTAAIVKIVEKPWKRAYINGQPHNHGFVLGSEKHITEVVLKKSGDLKIISGVQGLSMLKTTQSGFEGSIRDKYTTLPDTRERMMAPEVTATWRYPFQSLGSVPSVPGYFNERYDGVKNVLREVFFGPPKEGVYSPSVQSTLYQMAKATLARFQDIESVELLMPNHHFSSVNLSSKENPAMVKFADDVFQPADEPHGLIQASLTRLRSKL